MTSHSVVPCLPFLRLYSRRKNYTTYSMLECLREQTSKIPTGPDFHDWPILFLIHKLWNGYVNQYENDYSVQGSAQLE